LARQTVDYFSLKKGRREQKDLACVVCRCDWLERVLDVALHHQRPHFIARSFGPNNGDSPDDGIALDRWMADLLGHAR
jgi:hypothetical protein